MARRVRRAAPRPPVQAIILDLGNVLFLYEDAVEHRLLALFIGTSVRKLLPPYSRHLPAFQRGEISSREFIRRICRAVRKPLPRGAARFYGRTLMRIGRFNAPMLAFARQLRRRYRVAVLSNTVADHVRSYRRQAWVRQFDAVLFSNVVGMVKPDPRLFRLTSHRLRVAAAECLFTDDKLNHVRAAQRVGMRAVTFRSVPQFKRFLKRNGVRW